METQYDNVEIFRRNMDSLKETSKDTDSEEIKYMTGSEIKVVNFDKVMLNYIEGMKLAYTPCSNDALFISKEDEYYFVEFKNGVLKKDKVFEVYNKIYDSLLVFNDIIDKNISFCREHVHFILVYNESKNPQEEAMFQGNNAKASIGKYISKKAKMEYVRFGLDRFKKIYFRNVFTYTEKEFEKKFLSEMC